MFTVKAMQSCQMELYGMTYLPPANKVAEGNVFTLVCQSFCSWGGVYPSWTDIPPMADTPPRADTPRAGTPRAGTHPLGQTPPGRPFPGQTHLLGRHPPGQTPPPRRHLPPKTLPLGRHHILAESI